jgi:hypothetical protein
MPDLIKLKNIKGKEFKVDENGVISASGGLLGNVEGNVEGNLAGLISGLPAVTLDVAGPTAIDLSEVNVVVLDGSEAAAAGTIAAPVAGSILIVFCSDGTNDCTLTLTAGTFDGINEIATFADAGDALILYGLSATRFLVVTNTGTVALSTA